MKDNTQKEIQEAAGRLANVVDVGALTPSKLKVRGYSAKTNPIGKMYEVLTSLLLKQGVKDIVNSKLSISDVLVTENTEKMINKEATLYLKSIGYNKKRIERELAFASLELPATLQNKKVEKLMKLKDNRIYIVKEALEAALKVKKSKKSV